MTQAAGTSSGLGLGIAILGAVWLLATTARAVRGQREEQPGAAAARAFGWIVAAGMGYALLGLGAAMNAPESGGERAALVQVLAVALAAVLGGLVLSAPPGAEEGRGSSLSVGALFIAWLSLIGLPPVVGFHGKVLIYRSLLAAGWTWAIVVAMAGGVGALVTCTWALGSHRPPRAGGVRAALIVLLLTVVVVLGLYPEPALALAEVVTKSLGI